MEGSFIKGKSAGLTLIELIIVLALVAIIGAILIPNFLNTTDRARLRSDIQSARVLQNALDLYNAEQSEPMRTTLPMEGETGSIIAALDASGYIDARQAATQTHEAFFELRNDSEVVVNISRANVNVRTNVYRQLSDRERNYVAGGISGSE